MKCKCSEKDIEEEKLRYGRPMHFKDKIDYSLESFVGRELHCKNWDCEAALRMLLNNISPGVASNPDELIVYGGSGRAARNWLELSRIIETLKILEDDETLCIQSGKPVYIAKTHKEAPRIVLANSNIVPYWSDQKYFDTLDTMGLIMYGQMTAGSWIYIGTQGILQGTYQTLATCANIDFKSSSLKGKFVLTAGMGAMGGAQPLAGKFNEAEILVVEVREERIQQKVKEGYCDEFTKNLDEALEWIFEAKNNGEGLSVGLVGNAAEVYPELVKREIIPDVVTDQTPAHDLKAYVPIGDLNKLDKLRIANPSEYEKRSLTSIAQHARAMLAMKRKGAIVFDYGNNLRQQADIARVDIRNKDGSFYYPGFVQAYIRPLFCEGKGPFRWAAISGNPKDIYKIDEMLLNMFHDDKPLIRWIEKVQENLDFKKLHGLPARICWLGYGDRSKFGIEINRMVGSEEIDAPIVIGRDHLDCGSVASPNRETEGMLDGSDAIADWPLLNFALNAINGASWVSFHDGGGVGIGYALSAGMVIVADGTPKREIRLRRVLDADPGIGIARHVDAGYGIAKKIAAKKGIKVPK